MRTPQIRPLARTLRLAGLVPTLFVAGCLSQGSSSDAERISQATCSPGISTLCDYAICNSTQCDTDADCSSGQFCSRKWNQDLEWQTAGTSFGHCMAPSGSSAATNAVQADLCTLPAPADYSMGVVYRLPPNGALTLDDPDSDGVALTIDHRTILEGGGAILGLDVTGDANAEEGNDTPEQIALRVVVDLAGSPPNPTVHAAWTSVRDLTVRAMDNGGTNSSAGIAVHAHGVRVQNVRVMGFNFNILVESDSESYNANDFRFDNIISSGAHSYAAWIRGGDANAGLVTMAEIPGNTGIRESSFLGNTWIGTHFEGNTSTSVHADKAVSFWVDGSANALTAVGTYVEESDPAIEQTSPAAPTIYVGGNALRESKLPSGTNRVGYNRSRLVFKNDSSGYTVNIPANKGTSAENGVFQIQNRPEEDWSWQYKMCSGEWGWYLESTCSYSPMTFQGSGTVASPNADKGKYTLGTPF